MTKNEKYIVDMYVRYFGRAADAATIAEYALDKKTSVILKNIIADADAEKAGLSTTDFVNNAFQNLFGRDATTKQMNKYSKVVEKGKNLPINSIVKSAAKTDKKVYDNKKLVALKYAELGGKGDLDLSKISKDNLVDLKTVGSLSDLTKAIDALADNSGIPSSFDGKTFVLTTSVDTGKAFVGTAKNDLFVASDFIDGAGTAHRTWSVGDTIDGGKGIDGLKIVTAAPATGPGTTFTEAQFENNTMKSIEIVDISITGSGAAVNADISLDTTKAGKVAENFKAVTDLKLTTAGKIDVVGGKNIVAKAGAAITIKEDADATTAATIEKVTIDGLVAAGATIGGAAIGADNVDALKELTVKNTAVAGTVTVRTAVETLKVNFDNNPSTAVSTVTLNDAKLKTLNVDASGKDSSVVLNNTSAVLETINISGNAKLNLGASTVITGSSVKEINVTNTKGVVIVDPLGINTKFTGGTGADTVKIGATTKAISMGAGDDTVELTTATVLGTGGSVDAGAGKDTIKMTAAQADTISAQVDGKFNGTFSNFEVLEVTGASAVAVIDTEKINNVSQVNIVGAGTLATGSKINYLVNNGTVKITNDVANDVEVNLKDIGLGNTTDVLNLELSSTAALGSVLGNVSKVTAAGVETININVADAATAGSAAVTHALNLVATSATSVVVSGNNGLTLTNANTKITTFDASGVVANGNGDADAALGVTFTSVNNTVGQAVTIIGGAGDDKLTGSAQANDTIIGGKGVDTITYNGGKDSLTGGAGVDKFVVTAVGSKASYVTIEDIAKNETIDLVGITAGLATGNLSAAKLTVAAGTSLDTALNTATAGTTGTTTAAVIKWFQLDGNTYIVADRSANTSFNDGTDAVIKLAGLVDLSTASTTVTTDLITIA